MATTVEGTPVVEHTQSATRRLGWFVAAGVVALLVGLVVGWLIWGSDGDDAAST